MILFATPLYLPSTDPSVQQRGSSVVADSRWFIQPSANAQLLGQSTPIQYSLNVPSLSEITSHPGSGARLLVGRQDDGFWGDLAYGYKPINKLQVRYNAVLNLTRINAEIQPAVAYQYLTSADFGYTSGQNHFVVSYVGDKPVVTYPLNGPYQDFWQQQPAPVYAYSIHDDMPVSKIFNFDSVTLSLDYLRIFESITQDIDSIGVPRMAIFPYRTLYSNAAKVSLRGTTYAGGKAVQVQTSLLREFVQQGTVAQISSQVQWNARWLLSGGFDMISPDDNSNSNTDAQFINKFRDNNRFYAGANYVF